MTRASRWPGAQTGQQTMTAKPHNIAGSEIMGSQNKHATVSALKVHLSLL